MRGVRTTPQPRNVPDRDTEPEFPVAEPATSLRPITDVVPWIVIGADELRSLPLNHIEGFVLSLVDGTLTLEQILDLSSMSRQETLAIVRSLLIRGVIEAREPSRRTPSLQGSLRGDKTEFAAPWSAGSGTRTQHATACGGLGAPAAVGARARAKTNG